MQNKKTILLYGRSGSGKTTLIGELAEHVMSTLGLKTRLYTADRGGVDAIQPYIDLGIIQVERLGTSDPWIFIDQASKGAQRDKDGKWTAGDNAKIGCFAFESMKSCADSIMEWMKTKSAAGVNIGGGSNIAFSTSGDGQTLKIGGANQSHYGVAQGFMTEKIWASQNLNAPYIIWTSAVSKDDDGNAGGKILGPDVIGNKLTPVTPGWFDLTFRTDVTPASMGAKEKHLLYIGIHADMAAGGAAALGNVRLPLDAKPLEKTIIEPASLVGALKLLEGGAEGAKEVIRKRLGDKLRA